MAVLRAIYLNIQGVKYRWNKYLAMWENAEVVTETPARETVTFDEDVNMQNNLTVAGVLRAKKFVVDDLPTGIEDVEITESAVSGGNNVITFTYTNGESQTFNIKNGEAGKTQAAFAVVADALDKTGWDTAKCYLVLTETEGEFDVYSYEDEEWNKIDTIEIDLNFDVVQTTGQSTTSVMSQKAVTDEVTITQDTVIPYTQASGKLNLPSNATAYVVPSNDMVTRYIPVVAGNTYQISGSYSGGNVYARIGFATNVPAGGVAATVIYDILITGGFIRTCKPTTDGYLSISHFNQSGMTPAVFKLIGTPLKSAVINLDNQINEKLIDYTLVNNLNQAGGTTYVSANNYQTRYIPVKAGFTYIATFKTTTSFSTHYVRFASSNNIPANGVSSTFLNQLNAANTVVSFEYTAVNDGYLSVSYSHSDSYTYVSTFTQLAGKDDLGTAKAELIPIGGAMIAINTVYPADNTPRVIIPRTSYIVYKDKVLHLSDVYSQDITISLTGLSGILRVSFDSNAHTFAAKSISSDFGKTEMEVFTIDLTSGNVTLPDNFYRFNGVIGAGKEKRFYQASNKLGFTGNTLHTYDVINFGFPTIDGAQYVDDNEGLHALGDIAIYGNELFAFYQNGYVNVYDISDFKNVALNGTFKLQTDIHSNGAQFAPTIREGETYPLIYIANGVQAGGGDFTAVEQIKKVNGVYTSELVQTITVTNTPVYTINTIIGDDGYFWAIGSKGNASNIFYYAKFALPDISSSTVSLNYNNAIEKWTESKSYSVAPYVQGLCICQGKAFHVLGNGAPFNEIHVVDLNTRVALTDIVLTDYDQTKIQGCDVYKGCLIVSRNFGKGFTLIPLGDSASESGASNNPFKGKRLGIIGDSISTYNGSMPSGYANYYTDSNLGSISNIWWNIVCRELGMSFTNCSWSGSLVEGNSGSSSAQAGCSTKRIQDLGANGNPDIIICFIGCNDWRYGSDNNYTLGTWKVSDPISVTDRTITNFREAYAVMLYKLTTTYKDAKIFVCTNLDDPRRDQTAGWPSNNSDGISTYEWNQNIREIGEALSATIIDVHSCGLTFANMPDYCVDSDTPLPGTHPGIEGQAMIASKVIAQLLANCY